MCNGGRLCDKAGLIRHLIHSRKLSIKFGCFCLRWLSITDLQVKSGIQNLKSGTLRWVYLSNSQVHRQRNSRGECSRESFF